MGSIMKGISRNKEGMIRMSTVLQDYPTGTVHLAEGPLKARFELNRKYVMSLKEQNLLRCFYMEAGLWSYSGNSGTTTESSTDMDVPSNWHWGWESPTCELRGHMMGHWLSAAARIYGQTGDSRVKAKLDFIVTELAKCQAMSGDGWLAAFPQSYMHRLAKGKWVWAPHYTIHKLLMGLYEAYGIAGNVQALEIMKGLANWFYHWSEPFSREQMDEVLDLETGGMLEVWADLYGVTGDARHLELLHRYDRRRLFDALLRGEDVLTNKHANTQIPEILGAARAWEVTGEERWRQVVEAFWACAVESRGYVCTGAGDNAELWMPCQEMAERLGPGHEHCCCYNMMRLSHVLFRWTGHVKYADYWERRFTNGTLAQQHGETGMITYFLGVGAGSRKKWGSPTQDFWCCHGTLIQANTAYCEQIYMRSNQGITIGQWIPSAMRGEVNGASIALKLEQDGQSGVYPLNNWSVTGMHAITKVNMKPIPVHRPDRYVYRLTVSLDKAAKFELKLRLPWWLSGAPVIEVNAERMQQHGDSGGDDGSIMESGYFTINRTWCDGDVVHIELPKQLVAHELPGEPGTVAFMDGPIVLAGLVEEERQLVGDADRPEEMLVPDRERHHSWWNPGYYRTRGQERGIRFIPLCEVKDEIYNVYFPVKQ
jgi:uncharacterized protein